MTLLLSSLKNLTVRAAWCWYQLHLHRAAAAALASRRVLSQRHLDQSSADTRSADAQFSCDRPRLLTISVARTLLLAAGMLLSPMVHAVDPSTKLTHIHGLYFHSDGQLHVAGHHGILRHDNGRWLRQRGSDADLAGFSATRDALFASGHPEAGADSTGPLGLRSSTDGGSSWQALLFAGQADFHLLAAGYRSRAIYLLNPEPQPGLPQAGLYRVSPHAACSKRTAARDLAGDVISIAAHPDEAGIVVAGTETGLYLSRDGAESFMRISGAQRIFSVTFDPSGDVIWYGTYARIARLMAIGLRNGDRAREIVLPPMRGDAVAFIAIDPIRPERIAIATAKRSLYTSNDRGRNWTQLVHEGATHG